MIRAIGFMQGLRGDAVMSCIAARAFKQAYPESHLTLGLNRQFRDLLPLFHDHESYDATHTYQTYEGWPGPEDLAYLRAARYDHVFHAMPPHREDDWHVRRHQYAETCHVYGLPIPEDIRPRLTRWFSVEDRQDTVALAPFGGNGGVNDKQLSVEQAQGIVDRLRAMGWKVLHLGAPGEPDLVGAPRPNVSYFDAVRLMLSCRMLVHCDTGLGHFAGAYGHHSFGVYGARYHGMAGLKHIQPLHDRFRAYAGPTVAGLTVDEIWPSLKEHLYS